MKTAVIYYSYDGNSALIAEMIKAALNADTFEIKTADGKKRRGPAKFVWGGMQVIMHKKPELLPLAADIDAYDLIILGTPVWAASPAPAMISFLDGTNITGKKLALFCCHAGGKGRALTKFKALVPRNTIVGEADFLSPKGLGRDELKAEVEAWLKTFT